MEYLGGGSALDLVSVQPFSGETFEIAATVCLRKMYFFCLSVTFTGEFEFYFANHSLKLGCCSAILSVLCHIVVKQDNVPIL